MGWIAGYLGGLLIFYAVIAALVWRGRMSASDGLHWAILAPIWPVTLVVLPILGFGRLLERLEEQAERRRGARYQASTWKLQ